MTQIVKPDLAAGYVRVSTRAQTDGHSPELQEAAIRAHCAATDTPLLLVESDVETGTRISRRGYQRLLKLVRAGVVNRVVVYMYDRWGRDTGEWISRCNELRRLGVKLSSVLEGEDDDPTMTELRGVFAGKYSRDLAKRVRPARESAARKGVHCGSTPFGLARVYAAQPSAHGRMPAAQLVADPATAPTVQALFERWAFGSPMTLRGLAVWANAHPDLARPGRAGRWSTGNLRYLLRNRTYIGEVAYNQTPKGRFERAAPDSAFVVQALHEGIIPAETFAAAQERLRSGSGAPGPRVRRGKDGRVPLGAGLFVCSHCGGRMVRSRRVGPSHGDADYHCLRRDMGTEDCPGEYVRQHVAHGALLDQVKRLRCGRWDAAASARLVGDGGHDAEKAAMVKRLQTLRALFADHTKHAGELEGMPDDLLEAHRTIGRRYFAELQAIEEQVAAAGGECGANLITLEALHGRIRRLGAELARAEIAGDDEALREIIAPLVRQARIVERRPAARTRWARAEVTWSEGVTLLFKAGIVALADDVPTPDDQAERIERRRERQRGYDRAKAERRKEQRAAARGMFGEPMGAAATGVRASR